MKKRSAENDDLTAQVASLQQRLTAAETIAATANTQVGTGMRAHCVHILCNCDARPLVSRTCPRHRANVYIFRPFVELSHSYGVCVLVCGCAYACCVSFLNLYTLTMLYMCFSLYM